MDKQGRDAEAAPPFTVAELETLLIDGPLGDNTIMLTPVGLTWPMGFSFSSHVAQSVMVDQCVQAGFK